MDCLNNPTLIKHTWAGRMSWTKFRQRGFENDVPRLINYLTDPADKWRGVMGGRGGGWNRGRVGIVHPPNPHLTPSFVPKRAQKPHNTASDPPVCRYSALLKRSPFQFRATIFQSVANITGSMVGESAIVSYPLASDIELSAGRVVQSTRGLMSWGLGYPYVAFCRSFWGFGPRYVSFLVGLFLFCVVYVFSCFSFLHVFFALFFFMFFALLITRIITRRFFKSEESSKLGM